MERELTHEEATDLLGAFALDAVEPDEREAVEDHLRDCPRCRAEVADHRGVASFLASGGGRAPDGLWDRIAGALDESPPELRLAPVVPLSSRRSVSMRVGAGAAAVAAAVIAFLGVQVVHLNNQVDNLAAPRRAQTDLVVAANHALVDPAARRAALRSPDGRLAAEAVVLPDGTGFMVASTLPVLPAGRTYQLWAVTSGQKISAGVLGRDPQLVAFRYADTGVSAFALTDEQAGGVVASANSPVLLGPVRSA
jgi:anti-sigma factor RsiW